MIFTLKYSHFSALFSGIASLCTIGVISVERYIVVCIPMGAVLFQTRYLKDFNLKE